MVVYSESVNLPYNDVNWLLDLLKKDYTGQNQKIIRVNNVYGIFRAVQGSVGMAALPDYLAAEDPNLLRILPDMGGHQHQPFLFIQKSSGTLRE